MRASVLIVVLCVAVCATATHTPFFTRSAPPTGWTQGVTAPTHANVSFSLALKQRNIAKMEGMAMAVSDPMHVDYQKFMTRDEILALVAPPAAAVARVVAALTAAGVAPEKIRNLGDSLDVLCTVRVASTLFRTAFFEFHHATNPTVVRSMGTYSLPSAIAGDVDFVVGISSFPIPHLNARRHFREAMRGPRPLPVRLTDDGVGIIPQTYLDAYSVPPETPGAAAATSQGVIEFDGQNFSPDALTAYGKQTLVQVDVPSGSTVVGPNVPTDPQVEAQLDIEAMACVNEEATNWFWLESGNGWQYSFATHFQAAAPNVPSVISISYAWSEQDQCNTQVVGPECGQLGVDTKGYVLRVNSEYAKIALMGISVLSASGDSGANGRTDSDCSDTILHPDYPACSPWITSVGATQLVNATLMKNPPPVCNAGGTDLYCILKGNGTEVAVSFDVANFASGGGFSWYAPQPAWQAAAVQQYLSSQSANLPPASYFNASGRGFPDIAAIGHNFLILMGATGAAQPVGGTSVSAPVVASLVALLNQAAIAKSGKPLGFVSPLLYQMYAADATIFQDVTVGDNKCTEDGCGFFGSCKGFVAAPGWDPVTGLGSLNVAKALAYIGKMFDDRVKA